MRNWKSLFFLPGGCLLVLVVAGVSACGEREARAGPCPAVEVLVGFGIGGGTDLFARNLAEALQKERQVPVQVINLTGGSGVAAYRELISRPADGCTLLALTSDYVVLATMQPDDVDLNELRFLLQAHRELGLLSTRTIGNTTWSETVAAARREQRPVLIGGIGARSFDRLAVATTLAGSSVRYRYIPYSGAKEMQADLLGGRLDVIYDEFGTMKPLFDAGQSRPLVLLHDTPIDLLPDAVPAPMAGLQVPPPIWRGIVVHANTPQNVATELEESLRRAMQRENYKVYEAQRYLNMLGGMRDASSFTATVQQDLREFRAMLSAETQR